MEILKEYISFEETIKGSRFLSELFPCTSQAAARELIKAQKTKYADSTHVVHAFVIGSGAEILGMSDDGEPSGTAGKPILGQINSFELTNIVIVVIRYFGGIKLGTSGLIGAYREAARLAITAGEIIECHEQATLTFNFPYLAMNDVMKITKSADVKVLSQQFDNDCVMTIQTDADKMPAIQARILNIPGTACLDSE